ncbi:hypothetical protein JCM10212_000521 [Sporobolomyces blumeae]
MPLVIDPYLSPYTPYLRTPLYYLTWSAYYVSYVVSPGLLTVLQLVLLFLEHLVPRLEVWFDVEVRGRLERSTWANDEWRKGGKTFRELVDRHPLVVVKKDKAGQGFIRVPQGVWDDKNKTVKVGATAGWLGRGIASGWNWLASWFSKNDAATNAPPRAPSAPVTPLRPVAPARSTTFPLSAMSSAPRTTDLDGFPPFPRTTLSTTGGGGGEVRRGDGASVAYTSLSNRSVNPFSASTTALDKRPGSTTIVGRTSRGGGGGDGTGGHVLRERAYSGVGVSGSSRQLAPRLAHPHRSMTYSQGGGGGRGDGSAWTSPRYGGIGDDDDRGSVWSASGWRDA